MDDKPFTEDGFIPSKRKRSPGDLVDVFMPVPAPAQQGSRCQVLNVPGRSEHPLPKKPRLFHVGIADLPSSLLQHIFSFVDPRTLGCLVCVDKRFRTVLDPRCDLPIRKEKNHVYSTRPQDSVWSMSRRRFAATMPKPLTGLSELAQFALAFGTTCSFCGKPSPAASAIVDPWRAGPGAAGVRTIWPFKLRSCTACLMPRLRKDAEVLMSDDSHLRPGLPFAFFTQSMDFISQALVRDGSIPVGFELQKYYFVPDLETLRQDELEARSFGPAAAEEWFKGLPVRATEAQHDAGRFEHWELNGGLTSTRSSLSGKTYSPQTSLSNHGSTLPSKLPVSLCIEEHTLSLPLTLPEMPLYTHGFPPGLEPTYDRPDFQSDAASMGSQRSDRLQKPAKTSREIARIRAYKKEEVIARCRTLNPPILKETLERLGAFEAALAVPMPLNDNSWETLKTRLLEQRRKVMLEDEAKRSVQTAPIPGTFRPPSRSDEYVLAHADNSTREKLCKIADEFIRQKWGYGGFVAYPNAPQFASEVLIHTRQRYVEEQARIEKLRSQEGFLKLATAQDDALKLEDMKWVFEQTIKPRTEQIRKDLFLCSICTNPGSAKYFAFESIIQHYASKHSTAFSSGAAKVSWKAEWPEMPPFNPNPERVHTPTPSVTHTPTLSHKPLSAITPGSFKTTTIPSAGWRSPDTMSLISNTTHSYSISGRSATSDYPASSAPGSGMQEIQRDTLATGLLAGWTATSGLDGMPDSLRAYVAIASAVYDFGQKYRNDVSIDLFSDCVNTKTDLRELRQIRNLRCGECMIQGGVNSRAGWSLQELLIHFKKAHLRHSGAQIKINWKKEMIALPDQTLIKSFRSDPAVPVHLEPFLQEACTEAVLKSISTSIPSLSRDSGDFEHAPAARSHLPNLYHDKRPQISSSYHIEVPPYYPREAPPFPRQLISSVAATYDDRDSSRDDWSTTLRTIQDKELSDVGYVSRPPVPAYEPHARPEAPPDMPENHIFFVENRRDGDTHEPREESRAAAMSRSNTVRSYHSRGETHIQDHAEDFLSTIEGQVDVEMARTGLLQVRSTDTPGSVSRSNSALGVSTRASRRPSAERNIRQAVAQPLPYDRGQLPRDSVYQQPPPRTYDSVPELYPRTTHPVRAQPLQRRPSRLVEFDHHGTPIIRAGHIYHEISPPQRHISRHYIDVYRRPIDPPSPTYVRGPPGDSREAPVQRLQYLDDGAYPPAQYQRARYPAPTYGPERMYDPRTGQSFVPEQTSQRRMVETDASGYPAPRVSYDERGRTVQYLEIEPSGYRTEDMQYERYGQPYDDDRYQGR